MADFWQQVVSGLATGGVYAGLALAIVIVYRATRVVNFAQGELATLSTYIAWTLVHHGVPFWVAFFVTVLVSFAGGIVLERVVIRPFEGGEVLVTVIVTIGLLVLVNGLDSWIFGQAPKIFPAAFSTRTIDVGGAALSIQDIGVIGVMLGLVAALWVLFQHTKVGLGMRAAARSPEPSRLLGVRVGWMLALGWGLAAALGAVAGMLYAPLPHTLEPTMMEPVLLYALTAAILGGLDSPLGAVVGGLLLGVALNLLGAYVSFVGSELRLAVALALILAVLLVRPTGLLGRTEARRV